MAPPAICTIHYCIDGGQRCAYYHTALYGGNSMRDLLLQCSGVGAIIVALLQGVIGETRVFKRATIEPPRLRTLIRLVWQAGTVAWIGGGVLLIAAPWLASEAARDRILAPLAPGVR